MNDQLWWYVARSGGIVAWALCAASVLWGLALSTRALGKRPRPNWLLDLHRFLGGLAVVFVGVHVAALVADNYLTFGPTQILVPFTSAYRASAVAWGVVALYLLAAVEITSLLRSRIPRTWWRRTHFASFGLYLFATLHGLLAGTDSTGGLLFGAMIGTTAAVVGLTVVRIAQAAEPQAPAERHPADPALAARRLAYPVAAERRPAGPVPASRHPARPAPAPPTEPPVAPFGWQPAREGAPRVGS